MLQYVGLASNVIKADATTNLMQWDVILISLCSRSVDLVRNVGTRNGRAVWGSAIYVCNYGETWYAPHLCTPCTKLTSYNMECKPKSNYITVSCCTWCEIKVYNYITVRLSKFRWRISLSCSPWFTRLLCSDVNLVGL